MAGVSLVVDPRVVQGKKVKALRRQGIIPGHLYGRGTESVAVQVPAQNVTNMLRSSGRNAIIELQVNGEDQPRPVMVRGVQRDPVSGELVHIDFYQISLTERIKADVPLVLIGEPPAVTIHGGVLLQSLDHLTIESLPTEVPQHIEVDVSQLDVLDSAIFVRNLMVPASVLVLSDTDQVVAKVAAPRLAREEVAAEEEAEAAAAEGGEKAEGAAGDEKAKESE